MLKFHQKTISLVLALLLKPEGIFAHVGGEKCGTISLTPEQKAKSKEVTAKWKASGKRLVAEDVVIPTYFHIVNPDQNEVTGNEQAQIDDLNEGFAGTGFSFNLEDTTTINNDDWWGFSDDDLETDEAMKTDSRVGDCGALNVWWTDIKPDTSGGQTLGYAFLPEICATYQNSDGVVMLHNVGVGGSYTFHNEGATLIHEVGHWMGLLHTFEGGCGTDGDLVDDTPEVAEANGGFDCDAELDSCPDDGQGPDMLENHMDYLDDVCRTTFTPGQMERMVIQWNEYRDGCGCEEKSATTKILKGVFGFES